MSASARRRRRVLLAGLGLVLVGVVVAVALSVSTTGGGGAWTPQAQRALAPDVALTMAGGQQRSLASFRGRPVVIGFAEPYCTSCVHTLRTLDALAGAEGGGGVVPIALNVGGGSPGELAAFAAQLGVSRPLFAADPGLRAADAFGVQQLDTFVVIDAQGRLVSRGAGLSTNALMKDLAAA
jgi:cytochrome oxidase Cu insertion factor (SCO1/SenC/PrrC family)